MLDQREDSHYWEITARLGHLVRRVGEASDQVEEMQATAARQAAIVDSLEGLDQQVAALVTGLAKLAEADDGPDDGEHYRPASAPRSVVEALLLRPDQR